MDEIKARIQQTLDGLSAKKEVLEHHKKQYVELKFKLMDYEQYTSNDHPQLTVQMTSKARVKAEVVDPRQILVFLGAEYFVERDPSAAVKIVENKLKYLQEAIGEFEAKIKEAKKTLGNIDTLVEFQDKEDQDKLEQAAKGQSTGVELNEESLPFMEIREELDEDGNVISGNVEPQNQDKLKDFGANHGVDVAGDDDVLQELLRDMEIMPRQKTDIVKEPKIQEIEEHQKEDKEDKEGENERAMEDLIVERDVPPPVAPSKPIQSTKPQSQPQPQPQTSKPEDDFFALFKEMGIVNKSSKKSEPTPQEPSTSTETTTTINATEIHDPENILSALDKFHPSQPAIEEDDIMQLQLIADEMDEGDYEYGFDEDDSDGEEHDYENDDEEEGDYDDDWELEDGPENMVPDSYRELFAKELERVRGIRQGDDTITSTVIEKDTTEEPPKVKKSVSFAPELQIKEIENVSEELKQAQNAQVKMSKFKQMKQMKCTSNVHPDIEDNEEDEPLNDIAEKVPVMNDIVEREIIQEVTQPQPQPPKRSSRFKSSMSSLNPTKSKASTIIESETVPIRQKVEDSTTTPQRLSKFKSSRSTEQTSPAIVEVSDHKPVLIPVPINTFEPSPEEEYNNIRAYALNDEEDEDLLNAITESMVVFNPDEEDDYGQGSDDDDDDDEDEEEQGPMMLDNIVENADVDDPSYYVDDNILAKEYQDLRKKMIETYGEKQREAEERIVFKEEENKEFEPIDEFGNPVKVSRFRKGMKKA